MKVDGKKKPNLSQFEKGFNLYFRGANKNFALKNNKKIEHKKKNRKPSKIKSQKKKKKNKWIKKNRSNQIFKNTNQNRFLDIIIKKDEKCEGFLKEEISEFFTKTPKIKKKKITLLPKISKTKIFQDFNDNKILKDVLGIIKENKEDFGFLRKLKEFVVLNSKRNFGKFSSSVFDRIERSIKNEECGSFLNNLKKNEEILRNGNSNKKKFEGNLEIKRKLRNDKEDENSFKNSIFGQKLINSIIKNKKSSKDSKNENFKENNKFSNSSSKSDFENNSKLSSNTNLFKTFLSKNEESFQNQEEIKTNEKKFFSSNNFNLQKKKDFNKLNLLFTEKSKRSIFKNLKKSFLLEEKKIFFGNLNSLKKKISISEKFKNDLNIINIKFLLDFDKDKKIEDNFDNKNEKHFENYFQKINLEKKADKNLKKQNENNLNKNALDLKKKIENLLILPKIIFFDENTEIIKNIFSIELIINSKILKNSKIREILNYENNKNMIININLDSKIDNFEILIKIKKNIQISSIFLGDFKNEKKDKKNFLKNLQIVLNNKLLENNIEKTKNNLMYKIFWMDLFKKENKNKIFFILSKIYFDIFFEKQNFPQILKTPKKNKKNFLIRNKSIHSGKFKTSKKKSPNAKIWEINFTSSIFEKNKNDKLMNLKNFEKNLYKKYEKNEFKNLKKQDFKNKEKNEIKNYEKKELKNLDKKEVNFDKKKNNYKNEYKKFEKSLKKPMNKLNYLRYRKKIKKLNEIQENSFKKKLKKIDETFFDKNSIKKNLKKQIKENSFQNYLKYFSEKKNKNIFSNEKKQKNFKKYKIKSLAKIKALKIKKIESTSSLENKNENSNKKNIYKIKKIQKKETINKKKKENQNRRNLSKTDNFENKKLYDLLDKKEDQNKTQKLNKKENLNLKEDFKENIDFNKNKKFSTNENFEDFQEFEKNGDFEKKENFKNEVNFFLENFSDFNVPELPFCKGVILKIFKKKKESYKIDFNKIEIFSSNGKLIDFEFFIKNKKITKNFYFKKEKEIEIKIVFEKEEIISMLRIFNKKNEIQKIGISNLKKNKLFFFGNIKKMNFTTIMFTLNKDILKKISKNDILYKKKKMNKKIKIKNILKSDISEIISDSSFESQKNIKKKILENLKKKKLKKKRQKRKNSLKYEISEIISDSSLDLEKNEKDNNCKKLKLIIKKNWGCEKNFGFRKIEIFKKNKIPINPKNFKILTNISSKLKKKDLLENSEKIFLKKKNFNYFLEFQFVNEIELDFIKIQNLENGKALKNLLIYKNDELITNSFGFIIKKNDKENNFTQKIDFPLNQKFLICKKNRNFPSGFFLEIKFISNFGDIEQIGFENLEIFNFQNIDVLKKKKYKIDIGKNLEELENDDFEKKLEKNEFLINDDNERKLENDSFDNKQFYLKNNYKIEKKNDNDEKNKFLINSKLEKKSIFINFENPQFFKKIKIVNFKEKKAVKEIKILLDGFLLFQGFLKNKENNFLNVINFDHRILELFKSYENNINLINEKIS